MFSKSSQGAARRRLSLHCLHLVPTRRHEVNNTGTTVLVDPVWSSLAGLRGEARSSTREEPPVSSSARQRCPGRRPALNEGRLLFRPSVRAFQIHNGQENQGTRALRGPLLDGAEHARPSSQVVPKSTRNRVGRPRPGGRDNQSVASIPGALGRKPPLG